MGPISIITCHDCHVYNDTRVHMHLMRSCTAARSSCYVIGDSAHLPQRRQCDMCTSTLLAPPLAHSQVLRRLTCLQYIVCQDKDMNTADSSCNNSVLTQTGSCLHPMHIESISTTANQHRSQEHVTGSHLHAATTVSRIATNCNTIATHAHMLAKNCSMTSG